MDSAKNWARFDWTCASANNKCKMIFLMLCLRAINKFFNKPVKLFNLLYTRGAKLWLQRFWTAWYKSSRADLMEVEFWMATTASSSFCHATSCKTKNKMNCCTTCNPCTARNLIIFWQSWEFFHRLDDNLLDISCSWFPYSWRCFCQTIGIDQCREIGSFGLLHGRFFCLHLVFVTMLSLDSNQFPGRLTHIEPISG